MDHSTAYDSDEIISPNNRRMTRVLLPSEVLSTGNNTDESRSKGSRFIDQTLIPDQKSKTAEMVENMTDVQVQELLHCMTIKSSDEDVEKVKVNNTKIEVKKKSKPQKKKANNHKITKEGDMKINSSEQADQKESALLEKEIKTKGSKRQGKNENADAENYNSALSNRDVNKPSNDYEEPEKATVDKSKPERPKRALRGKHCDAQEVSSEPQVVEKPSKKGREGNSSLKDKNNGIKVVKTKMEKSKPTVESLEVDLNKTITENKTSNINRSENISSKPTKGRKKNVSEALKEITKPENKPLTAVEEVPVVEKLKTMKKSTKKIADDKPNESVQKPKKKATSAKENQYEVQCVPPEQPKTNPRTKRNPDIKPHENKVKEEVAVTKRVTRNKQVNHE